MPTILFLYSKPEIFLGCPHVFFELLPENYSGFIIFPISKFAIQRRGWDFYNKVIGKFKCYPILKNKMLLFYYFKIIYKALYINFSVKKIDIVFSYDPLTFGFLGYLISKFIKAKIIINVPGNFKKAFLFDSNSFLLTNRIKNKLSDLMIPFILKKADYIKLLYPEQLNGYINNNKLIGKKVSVFHNFVPISILRPSKKSDKYILFLGYPWFLKGVDILIRAFNLISNEFPDYRLKIVGFCPDMTYFRKLADGNNQIELRDPVFYDEAMELMSKCALFVLPSRTEAMGRVLLEAMAHKKPIIASNVDGIPYYVKSGFNGLLFESENVDDLANKLRIILSNPEYAKELAENGYAYVHEYLSEECFVKYFKNMIEETLK